MTRGDFKKKEKEKKKRGIVKRRKRNVESLFRHPAGTPENRAARYTDFPS